MIKSLKLIFHLLFITSLYNQSTKMAQLLAFSLFLLCIMQTLTQFVTVVNASKSYTSVSPTWLTSPYFRAGNQAVISTLTGSSLTPVFTFTFSSPLTGLPNLAYGIKNYRGNDYMGQEFYQIKKIGLTQATFTVQIQIYGVTNLWLLNVAYLAVEPAFPHHFNTFENVPLNYSSGAITNISVRATGLTYFTEYINYTQQASAMAFKTFASPLSSNVIVLFMTSLWIQGTFGLPVQFHITPTVLSQSIYSLNATLLTQVMITNVHFSQVIFNTIDVESSNQYQVVYYEWDNDMNGGWRSLPSEFVDNFIMGVTAFEASNAQCGFEYQWEFANNTGVFGVQVLKSWTVSDKCGFSYSQTSVLYISTWLCVAPYIYFNITTQMCQDLCGGYFIENANSSSCVMCTNPTCYTCDAQNSSYCIQCAAFDHMFLDNGTCLCMTGYFYLTGSCVTCSSQNAGCQDCAYGIISTTLPYNASDFQCFTCNQTNNYFLVGNYCVLCTIPHCDSCSSLTTCQLCDATYSIDYLSTCSQCAVLGCFTCLPTNNLLCGTCYNLAGFFIIPATQQCTSICGDSLTAIGMEACDDGNNMDGDGCSSTCILQPFYNCTILANFTTVCLPVCGDGMQNGGEACDDGNLIDGDACSHICQLEVTVSLIRQQRDLSFCNKLQFGFNVKPYFSFMETLEFPALMVLNSSFLTNPSFSFTDQQYLSISYDFTNDMVLEYVTIIGNATLTLQYSNYTFLFSPSLFQISPDNNVPANFLDDQMCSQMQSFQQASKILQITSFVTLFLTMIPGKIIGLQLFGVLQLAYFSLGSIDSVNVLLSPLMNMKQLNGYSTPVMGSSPQVLPKRVKSINYYPSFLDNFNIMFLLLFIQLFIGLVLYFLMKVAQSPSKCLIKLTNKLLKQVFLTLILFNCFNISYSFALYYRYAGDNMDAMNIITSIMSLAALILMTFMIAYANPEGFGEFKEKFKEDFVMSSYMAISVLYRASIGFILAFSNDDQLSTLFALGISLMFLLYNLINLPFVKAYHNYRACLCHFTQFVTIFVAMYYRSMKSTTSPVIVASIYSPAKLQFALLFICLIVSLIILAYDTYLFVKELFWQKKISQIEENKENPIDISQQQVMMNQYYGTDDEVAQANSINQVTI